MDLRVLIALLEDCGHSDVLGHGDGVPFDGTAVHAPCDQGKSALLSELWKFDRLSGRDGDDMILAQNSFGVVHMEDHTDRVS